MLRVGWNGGVAGEAAGRRVVRLRVVDEEERLAAAVDHFRNDDRSAEREGADVRSARAPRVFYPRVLLELHLLLQVGRVHLVVPVRVVGRAAQRVGAAPRHHRYREPGAVALRGVEVRRLDPHLLNLVGVRRAGDAAAEAVVRRAVDGVVVAGVAAVEAAAGADLTARGVGRALHVALEDVLHFGFRRRDARREARQHDRHVREHRQAFDHLPIEVVAGRDRRRVEQRRLGHNGDLIAQLTDFQLQLQVHGLTDGQGDVGLRQRLVSLQLDANLVRAGIEQDGLEVAAAVGHELLRLTRAGVRDLERPAPGMTPPLSWTMPLMFPRVSCAPAVMGSRTTTGGCRQRPSHAVLLLLAWRAEQLVETSG